MALSGALSLTSNVTSLSQAIHRVSDEILAAIDVFVARRPERDLMSCYGDDFCCDPPEDVELESYECPRCQTRWYRVQIASLTRRPTADLMQVALDDPKTAWSTKPPWS